MTCRSPRATLALGRALGRITPAGSILGLIGHLGTGKTMFTRGFLSAFGVRTTTSPTFVLVKEIPVRHGPIRRIIHADLYRLPPGTSLDETGLTDAIGRADTITLIEWADRLSKKPKNCQSIRFTNQGQSRRLLYLPAVVANWLTSSSKRRALAAGPARLVPHHHRR